MEKKTILLVEDEPSIADNFVYALSTEGFNPVHCTTGRDALEALAKGGIALLILDLGLPDVSGFDLLREIRRTSSVPLIVVTSRAEEVDRIVGLEIGADDYVVKPVSPRELTARVRAILRRVPENGVAPIPGSERKPVPFDLDEARCVIRYHGEPLDLSRYEYRLLGQLIRNPGRVFTREQLLGHISEEPEMSLDRTIDTHIKTIRQKLKSIRHDDNPILTHRGLGYSLAEQG
jgi:two-component system catabolic regulation response regulator CreB